MQPPDFIMRLTSRWPRLTGHVIALLIGWLGFSILFGLFHEFDRMEASNADIPSLAISELLMKTGLTFFAGIIILAPPIFIWWQVSTYRRQKKL